MMHISGATAAAATLRRKSRSPSRRQRRCIEGALGLGSERRMLKQLVDAPGVGRYKDASDSGSEGGDKGRVAHGAHASMSIDGPPASSDADELWRPLGSDDEDDERSLKGKGAERRGAGDLGGDDEVRQGFDSDEGQPGEPPLPRPRDDIPARGERTVVDPFDETTRPPRA